MAHYDWPEWDEEDCNPNRLTCDSPLIFYHDVMVLTQYRDRPNTMYKKGGRYDNGQAQGDDYSI